MEKPTSVESWYAASAVVNEVQSMTSFGVPVMDALVTSCVVSEPLVLLFFVKLPRCQPKGHSSITYCAVRLAVIVRVSVELSVTGVIVASWVIVPALDALNSAIFCTAVCVAVAVNVTAKVVVGEL